MGVKKGTYNNITFHILCSSHVV